MHLEVQEQTSADILWRIYDHTSNLILLALAQGKLKMEAPITGTIAITLCIPRAKTAA
jgi:hypothetical protein